MITQRFKTVIAKSGSRTFIALPFNPDQVWGDAMGGRVYTLTKRYGNSMLFSMIEKMVGPLCPLFASAIPSFDDSFG